MKSLLIFNNTLATLLLINMLALPKEAAAVCSTDERIQMAMDGIPKHEIDRECDDRGPIVGNVCSTLRGKCRLPRPQEFFSPCYCIDEYGHSEPGKVQQY